MVKSKLNKEWEEFYPFFKTQINLYKSKNGYTIKQISELASVPQSTIAKIFAGVNKNPTLETIKKIAEVLGCTVDDLLNQTPDDCVMPYYLDKKTGKIAQELFDNNDLKVLFDASRDLSPDDIKAVTDIVNRLRQNKSY